MYHMFSSVRPYLNPKAKVDVPRPDNFVFCLHYRVTFSILLVACILVSSYGFIDSSGSAIQCMMDSGVGVPNVVINRFCWISSTFTLPKHYQGEAGIDFIYFGVGAHSKKDEKVYHAYYQWVPLVLAMQAVMFYFPHWLWKIVEGGRMKHIIVGLNAHLADEVQKNKKIGQLVDYMETRLRHTREHKSWARNFFICESLNLVNVVSQIFIVDSFLGGEFTTYGTEVLQFASMDSEDRVDPMSRIFPRMTKCTFHKFGGSGTVQKFDALCVLGMNIINEKIYIFLWFWFIILAVVTGVNLLLRLMQLVSPAMRDRLIKLENLGHLGRHVSKAEVEVVVNRLSYSDWLIIYYLAQSMNKTNFGSFISKLASDLPDLQLRPMDEESITPPSGFEEGMEVNELKKYDADSGAGTLDKRSTLKSPAKFGSFLRKTFRKV